MPKVVIHTATGEFRDEQGRLLVEGVSQGWTTAGCPAPTDPAFSIVTIPAGVVPDQRTQKWNGSAVVARSQADIDTYDAARPRYVDSRVMLLRMTANERWKLWRIAHVDKDMAGFIMLFLSRAGRVDVNDPLSKQGWAMAKAKGLTPPADAGITAIWPDAATADARVAEITK